MPIPKYPCLNEIGTWIRLMMVPYQLLEAYRVYCSSQVVWSNSTAYEQPWLTRTIHDGTICATAYVHDVGWALSVPHMATGQDGTYGDGQLSRSGHLLFRTIPNVVTVHSAHNTLFYACSMTRPGLDTTIHVVHAKSTHHNTECVGCKLYFVVIVPKPSKIFTRYGSHLFCWPF